MEYFDDSHERGSTAPVSDPEIDQHHERVIPAGLIGLPTDRLVKGFRRMRFSEIAENYPDTRQATDNSDSNTTELG
ncbi:MAG: hypothetical protein QG628_14 [Patescibacteria group bacterium]|nr:hypothetical protein [Patescibacteria group bacterium]